MHKTTECKNMYLETYVTRFNKFQFVSICSENIIQEMLMIINRYHLIISCTNHAQIKPLEIHTVEPRREHV